MVLKKTFENPLDSKEIKPVNSKGNFPEYTLERLMLKLKLQYFGHLIWRVDSLEMPLMLEKIECRGEAGDREWDGCMALPTQWTWVWGNSKRQWKTLWSLACCSPWGHRAGHDLATEQNTDNTYITFINLIAFWLWNPLRLK